MNIYLVKTLERTKGDMYLWKRYCCGDAQYAWTECINANKTVIFPTATARTWHSTEKEAWENRPQKGEMT